jgi:diguanylate cyclase (GGDEF)-like protein
MLPSFKHKLAVYFLLLAVLPLAAAFWGFSAVTKRSEARRVDARLEAELRAVFASYERRLGALRRAAHALGTRAAVQQGFRTGRFGTLPPDVEAPRPGQLRLGPPATLAATEVVHVRERGRAIGSIVATMPLDRTFLRKLRSESGLTHGDRIVFVPRSRRDLTRLSPGTPAAVTLGESRYRALASAPVNAQRRVQLVLLAPADAIDAETASVRWHLLLVLLAALVVLAAIAAAEGRSIMRSVGELASAARAVGRGRLDRRVPVRGRDEFADLATSFNSMADQLGARVVEVELERTRLRDSLARFGELLAATHDPEQLLSVIAAAAAEAADAEGAVLLGEEGSVVEVGTLADDAQRVELPLAAGESRFGILILYVEEISDDALAAVKGLAAQAAVALENARLHAVVEEKATSDGLTGLANRRHCEEALRAEIARSQRYDLPIAVILADIDDFKAANDTYGHSFGDLVLQQFAAALGETLRDIDVSGRWGGEEFLIVLPGTTLTGAVDAAERIRAAFADRELAGGGEQVRLTASFGVADLTSSRGADGIVDAADAALYDAKRAGKNRVVAAGAGATAAGR